MNVEMTYAYTPVHATSYQMDIVKLKSGDGPSVAD